MLSDGAFILLFVCYSARVSGCVGVHMACVMFFEIHWEDACLMPVEISRQRACECSLFVHHRDRIAISTDTAVFDMWS